MRVVAAGGGHGAVVTAVTDCHRLDVQNVQNEINSQEGSGDGSQYDGGHGQPQREAQQQVRGGGEPASDLLREHHHC